MGNFSPPPPLRKSWVSTHKMIGPLLLALRKLFNYVKPDCFPSCIKFYQISSHVQNRPLSSHVDEKLVVSAAPEIQTTSQCTLLSDLFSLGMVICAVFNNGKSLIEANHSNTTYMKQFEVVSTLKRCFIFSSSTIRSPRFIQQKFWQAKCELASLLSFSHLRISNLHIPC